MWRVAPTRQVPFVSAKVPKTISARARPQRGSSTSAPNRMLRNSLQGAKPPFHSNNLRQKVVTRLQLRRTQRRADTQKTKPVFQKGNGRIFETQDSLLPLILNPDSMR